LFSDHFEGSEPREQSTTKWRRRQSNSLQVAIAIGKWPPGVESLVQVKPPGVEAPGAERVLESVGTMAVRS
jgi:hypothetical protein